jgi:hypothetical protein
MTNLQIGKISIPDKDYLFDDIFEHLWVEEDDLEWGTSDPSHSRKNQEKEYQKLKEKDFKLLVEIKDSIDKLFSEKYPEMYLNLVNGINKERHLTSMISYLNATYNTLDNLEPLSELFNFIERSENKIKALGIDISYENNFPTIIVNKMFSIEG